MTRITTWILATAVVVVGALDASPARADGKNEIRAVTFDDSGGTTRIVVRGAQTPTFTVYKLERPSRVVLDLPSARLAEALRGHESAATFTPSTWAVSTVAAQQLDDGGQIVRVIVTLARPGRYDVKTEGNAVVVLVSARDPAPAKGASSAELASAQSAAAKAQSDAAKAQGDAARAQTDAAKARAEADRLRQIAADAQRAADDAKRASQQGQQATAATLAKNKQLADQALQAKQAAQAAQVEADRARAAAETAKSEAIAEAARARKEAEAAKADVARSRAELAKAQQAVANANASADARTKQEAERAKAAIEAARVETANAQKQAELAQRRADAAQKQLDAVQKQADAAQKQLVAAQQQTETARRDATAKEQELSQKAREIEAAKAEATRARDEARMARADADAAKASAASEKRRAEIARTEADKVLRDANDRIATLAKKTAEAQAMEDKARAANAAAQAREEAAREVAMKAARDREQAEIAAKRATEAAARTTSSSAQERERMLAEAKRAEAQLVAARRATEEAEAKRRAAESAAANAKHDLERTRSTLASVEQQRTAAESAASDASKKRSEALAAVEDAKRRRLEAETAAEKAARERDEAERAARTAARERGEAEQQKVLAEQQRKAAERAARDAKVAAEAAERQRLVAESATKVASDKRAAAESSLAELNQRRQAAERAAADLEARSKAEAKAQANLAAATARKAAAEASGRAKEREQSDAELAKARAAATALADERKRAESELAERRKAVTAQQADVARLERAAASAREAAAREESRRAALAEQRLKEEQELARIQQQKAAAARIAAAPAPAVPVTPVAYKAPTPPPPAPAPVVKPAPVKLAKVSDVRYWGSDGEGKLELLVDGSAGAKVATGTTTATHVELIIDNAELGPKLEKKLDVSKLGSPVRAISTYRDRRTPNRVRVVVELASPATPKLDITPTGMTWQFVGAKQTQLARNPIKPRTTNLPSPVVGGFGAASTPVAQQSVAQLPPQGQRGRRVYRGPTVDLDFKDAPIHDLLRALSDVGKVNIVIPEGINPKVTVRMKKVPWDQALEVILQSHGLWYRRDATLIRVADRKDLDKEDEAEAARREAMVKAESPRVDTVPLNYASATELKPKLEAMLSPKGRIEVDERTNQLIISDVAGNREQIARLALQLDTQTPQIQIEARIVEARSTFLRQFGIQWGGRAVSSAAGGNATGLVFPSSISLIGGNEDQQTVRGGVATPSDFAINLPAATGSGEGGALGLSLGSVGGNFNINLRLSALEDTGTIRIISAPKITVLNNKLAKISQGVSIPISVISAQGTQTQFVQADLSLEVTPYVSQRDCAIAMNINVTKNEPDFVNVGARGDPTILRKEAKTTMLVNNGETSVLGGIYTRNTGLAYKKFPFLGDLPVFGWLFKNRRENDDRTEILVFITPKITNKAALRCE